MGREWVFALLLACVVDAQDPQLVGQGVIGLVVGGAVGTISGSSAQVFSAAQPSQQDAVTFLWSGMAGGFLTAYRMKNTEENRDMMKPSHERIARLRDGFHTGMVAGAVAGGLGQVLCGSSDEGGSSASSGSSSSSSNPPANDNAVALGDKAPNSLQTSGQMPILAAAFAGGMAGAIVSFFEPEILVFSGVVGSKVIEGHEAAAHHSKTLHKQAIKHSKTAAKHLGNIRGHIVEAHRQAVEHLEASAEKRKEIFQGIRDSIDDLKFDIVSPLVKAQVSDTDQVVDQVFNGLAVAGTQIHEKATNLFNRGAEALRLAPYAKTMPLEGYDSATTDGKVVPGRRVSQKKTVSGTGRANVCLPPTSDDPEVPANIAVKCATGVIKRVTAEATFGKKQAEANTFLQKCLDKPECDVGVCDGTFCEVPGCDEMVKHGTDQVRRNKFVEFRCE